MARNLITWNVPVEDSDDSDGHRQGKIPHINI